MTQQELEAELCSATGESLHTIRRYGFQLQGAVPEEADEDRLPHILDWDEHTDVRGVAIHPHRSLGGTR